MAFTQKAIDPVKLDMLLKGKAETGRFPCIASKPRRFWNTVKVPVAFLIHWLSQVDLVRSAIASAIEIAHANGGYFDATGGEDGTAAGLSSLASVANGAGWGVFCTEKFGTAAEKMRIRAAGISDRERLVAASVKDLREKITAADAASNKREANKLRMILAEKVLGAFKEEVE